MKHFKGSISKAVGLALILFNGSAFAYLPTSNTDADLVIYWAGSTSSTLGAQKLAVQAVCGADTHLLYVPVGSGANPDAPLNDWIVACRESVGDIPGNLRILIVKRDRGGSGVGVGAVQVNTPISYLTVAGNCTVTPAGAGQPVIPAPGGVGNVPLRTCLPIYTTNALTEMGTSDIEPNKFFGINTPVVDGSPMPYLNVPFGEQYTLAGLTFNTPVTLALYQVLQSEQFAAADACNPTNAGYGALLPASVEYRVGATVGESEACMPSLTRAEIGSLLAISRIVQWNRLLETDGTPIDATLAYPAIGTLPVQICRRVEGSGSQATINALINDYPCDADAADGAINTVLPRAISFVPGTGPVYGNSGSGDVSNCLRDRNLDAANPYAIGILSVEGRNTAKTLGWRYIKVDGKAPTLKNIHAGDYFLFAQQSCQLRSETLNFNAPLWFADTVPNKTLLFQALCGPSALSGLNNVNALNNLNAGSVYDWGYSGWLATPSNALLYDNTLDYLPTAADGSPARPVNAVTREVTAGRTNICQSALKSSFGGNAARGIKVTTP